MKKHIIVITGASSGIGAATAKSFHNKGYQLILLSRDIEAMKGLELKSADLMPVDVTDKEQVNQAIELVIRKYKKIDCLINSAGIAISGEYQDSVKTNAQTINVNVIGTINTIDAVLPNMQANKYGTIINLSSIADRKSRPNLAAYAASKAAIRSLTESLREANAKYGIRFTNLAPAKIATPMMKTANLAIEDAIPVANFAEMIVWVYEQPQTICIRDMVVAPTCYEA
ncbi:MAG: oxidoreductase [Legionellales bacterium]|nr:oxidoreductase [Legionellales bacterium]|tara:strand:- start:1671 stop:2354 length:684 start_codon:yes stop_codon:yes gene_type:complete